MFNIVLGVFSRSLELTIADEAAWYRNHGMLPQTPRTAARQRGLLARIYL